MGHENLPPSVDPVWTQRIIYALLAVVALAIGVDLLAYFTDVPYHKHTHYGFEKVRFINPVLSGKRIRASAVTSAVELKGTAVNSTRTITVEIEGEGKPALVADWIGRTVYDS